MCLRSFRDGGPRSGLLAPWGHEASMPSTGVIPTFILSLYDSWSISYTPGTCGGSVSRPPRRLRGAPILASTPSRGPLPCCARLGLSDPCASSWVLSHSLALPLFGEHSLGSPAVDSPTGMFTRQGTEASGPAAGADLRPVHSHVSEAGCSPAAPVRLRDDRDLVRTLGSRTPWR